MTFATFSGSFGDDAGNRCFAMQHLTGSAPLVSLECMNTSQPIARVLPPPFGGAHCASAQELSITTTIITATTRPVRPVVFA
jgi:hypothetical protein